MNEEEKEVWNDGQNKTKTKKNEDELKPELMKKKKEIC